MNKNIIVAGAFLGAALFPLAALAQDGVAAGAATGAIGGAIVGGPVGLVIGGVGGAIVGGITEDTRPRFREYVVRENRPSYTYREDPRIGIELPDEGISYYEVPRDYGQTQYRYTIVNGRTVLVDPRTRRIVQIIE